MQTIAERNRPNLGRSERVASLVGAGALTALAVARRSRASIPLLLSGGYLAYRGITGKDYVYEALGINRLGQAGIQAERTVTVDRPRAEVYAFWRDFEILPSFMQHLQSVKVTGERRSHWVACGPLDSTVEWDADLVEDRPDELIAWQSLPGSMVDNQGVVTFNDAPGGRGTEVHVQLVYNPPAGSAGAAFAKVFGEAPNKQILDDLRHFKQIIESGETATVTGQTSGRCDQVEQERDGLMRQNKDWVQEASEESFPASDSPGWAIGAST